MKYGNFRWSNGVMFSRRRSDWKATTANRILFSIEREPRVNNVPIGVVHNTTEIDGRHTADGGWSRTHWSKIDCGPRLRRIGRYGTPRPPDTMTAVNGRRTGAVVIACVRGWGPPEVGTNELGVYRRRRIHRDQIKTRTQNHVVCTYLLSKSNFAYYNTVNYTDMISLLCDISH